MRIIRVFGALALHRASRRRRGCRQDVGAVAGLWSLVAVGVAALWLASALAAGSALAAAAGAPGGEGERGGGERSGYERNVALVTGSTSGLGREVARRLASDGWHVIVHGRNVERGEALVEEIEEQGIGSARFYRSDFVALENVRSLAEAIRRDYERLDLLVNNAGIFYAASPERQLSEDGYELHFQVNYLSHFLLTDLLQPMLEASAPARIINVASAGQAPIDFEDPHIERDYSAQRAYGQSKLAQITYTIALAERLEGTRVSTFSLHPATFMDTRMVRQAGVEPQATVDEGADAVMQLITEDGLESGQYFDGLEPARAHEQAYDEEARERLWRLSQELTGV